MAKQRSQAYVIMFDDGVKIRLYGKSREDCEYCLQNPASAISIEPENEMEFVDVEQLFKGRF